MRTSAAALLISLSLDALAAAGSESGEPWPAWHPLREARKVEPREESSTTMSESVYRQLSQAHELLGDGKLDAAIASLQRVGTRNLRPYELAQVQQAFGFVYAQQGRDDEALAAFEQCIELDALPTFVQQGIVYSVASYYAGQERYAESNAAAMRWFRHEADPGADAYMLVGVNHVQQGEMLEGLPYVRRANRLATPRAAWMQVELAILVESDRLDEAIAVAEEIVGLWPNEVRYYETLSGLLMQTGDDDRALAALTVPWLRGLLVQEAPILKLVRLNLHLHNPARGAEVLAAAMEAGRVRPTFENLELLMHAWAAAKEARRAAAMTDRLAVLARNGEYHLRKALLLNESGDWRGAADAAADALAKGGLERPGEAWVLRGTALAELERPGEAVEAFENAKREGSQATRRAAAAWIVYMEDRRSQDRRQVEQRSEQ